MIKREKKFFKSSTILSAFFFAINTVPTSVLANEDTANIEQPMVNKESSLNVNNSNTTINSSIENLPAISAESNLDNSIKKFNKSIKTGYAIDTLTSSSASVNYTIDGNAVVGNTITISINANSVSNLYGASIDFLYDTNILQIEKVSQGSLFAGKISKPLISTIDNGQVNIAMSLTGAATSISGSGTIATITAKVLKEGTINLKTTNEYNKLSLDSYTTCVKLSTNNGDKIGFSYMDKSFNSFVANLAGNLTVNKVSPQNRGTTLKLTGSASGYVGDVQYKFYYKDAKGYTILKDFSSTNVVEWTPSAAGTYTLYINVKDSLGKVYSKSISYVINEYFDASLSANKVSPQNSGTTIKLTSNAVDYKDNVEYKFYYKDSKGYSVIQAYSKSNTAEWTPRTAGDYVLYVDAKDSTGKVITKYLDYTISPNFNITLSANKTAPQNSGTTLKLTGTPYEGNGDIQYKFYYKYDNKYTVIRDYSESNEIDWIPNVSGDYVLYADAKDSTGKIVSNYLDYTVNPCFNAKLSVDKVSPQISGTSIKLIGNAYEADGDLEYKFYYKDSKGYTVIQAYSKSDEVTWTPSTAGDYTLYMEVKDSVTGKVVKSSLDYTITASFNAVLSADKLSPQNAGTAINLTCNASYYTDSVQYKFYYKDISGYTVLKAYSDSNIAVFKPTKAGTYTVFVDVKDMGTGKIITKTLNYTITSNFDAELSVDKNSPQNTGNTINLTGTALNTVDAVQYKFYYKDSSGYTILKAYSTSNTAEFKPTKAGTYTLFVDVKDSSGKVISKSMNYVITSSFDVNLSVDKVSPQINGTTIKLTGTALNSVDAVQYKFYYKDSTGYTVLKAYSASNTAEFTPTKAGTYTLFVDVKDSSGKVISKSMNYTVTAGFNVLLDVDKTSPQPNGTTLKLTGTALDCAGDAQYKFYYKDSTGYTVLKAYSTSNTAEFTPAKAGTYTLFVDVKDSNGKTISKSMTYTIK